MSYGNGTYRGYTALALAAEEAIVIAQGDHDDVLYVVLADTGGNVAEVEIVGRDGVRTWQLSKAGDTIRLPLYGVAVATIRASAYPTTVGWAILPATGSLVSGLTRTT